MAESIKIRDIVIALGFEIDKSSVKKVNDYVDGLKEKISSIKGNLDFTEAIKQAKEMTSEFNKVEATTEQIEENLKPKKKQPKDKPDDEDQNKKLSHLTVGDVKGAAAKLFGAVGNGVSLVETNALAEEFNGINDQIRNATRELGDQQEIQKKIMETANKTRTSYGDTAKFVGALVQENKELFGTVDEAARFAELSTKLFKGAGKGNEEVAALQEAINKSFAKGIVDSETINQLYERAPEAIALLTDELGVAKESLAQMATDGSMTVADLKNAFLNHADTIEKSFSELDLNMSDALLNIRNQWGYFIDKLNSSKGITKTVAKYLIDGFTKFINILEKTVDWLDGTIKKLGGLENAIKLVAAVAGSIYIALHADKIKKFFKVAITGLKSINKQMILTQLKTFAIMAVLLALFLIVDDFIGFLQGKDSVIGSLFDIAGIGSEKARETILGVWKKVKGFLSETWNSISKIGQQVWKALSQFWEENCQEIFETISSVWNAIVAVVSYVWKSFVDVIQKNADRVQRYWDKWGGKIKAQFGFLWDYLVDKVMWFLEIIRGVTDIIAGIFSGDWKAIWKGLKELVESVWDNIMAKVNFAWKTICNIFGISSDKVDHILEELGGLAETVFKWIEDTAVNIFNGLKAFWEQWGSQIMAQFGIIWDYICGLIEALKMFFQGFIDFITGVFTGNWEQAWEGIMTMFQGIMDAIKNIFTTIWDSIYNWFGDKIDAFVKKVTGFADKIKGIFGGVLDFFGGIGDAIGDFFGGGSMDATVKATTVNASAGGGNKTTNVHQNVEINNKFEGGERAAQVEGARAMEQASVDLTSQQARALRSGG